MKKFGEKKEWSEPNFQANKSYQITSTLIAHISNKFVPSEWITAPAERAFEQTNEFINSTKNIILSNEIMARPRPEIFHLPMVLSGP